MNPEALSVSVIIPVYNGEAFLAEAIQSIEPPASQSLEIIVVDDGSTDGTAAVAARCGTRVHYAQQAHGGANRGPAAARNRGLELAQGEVICFLDADDLWREDKLAIQLAHLRERPELGIVMGQSQIFRQTGLADGQPQVEFLPLPPLFLSLGSAAIRRAVFDRVGLFDEALRQGEDLDWFMRARELGVAMLIHQEVVQLYRRHEGNVTNHNEVKHSYLLRMLRQSLARRRQSEHGVAALPPLAEHLEARRGINELSGKGSVAAQ